MTLPATQHDREYTAYCFSDGIIKAPYWRRLLGVCGARRVGFSLSEKHALLVDWGNKRAAQALAVQQKSGLPLVRLEDGFIRSVGLGVQRSSSYSLVVDELGIYYDAGRESRLERLLNGDKCDPLGIAALDAAPLALDDPGVLARAERCMALIRRHGISKYNNLTDLTLETKTRRRILLVDQTQGDLSVAGGLADETSFRRMLDEALSESGDKEILIKTHPDVIAGRKSGYLDIAALGKLLDEKSVVLLSQAVNPYSLLAQVDEVRVVTSQLGFEALIAGLPVRCYGAPFYAGWGLTEDRVELPRRRRRRSLAQLFAAAYLIYCRYFDPDTGERCELEDLLAFMIRQRQMFQENSGALLCCGFPPWRRAYLRAYLQSPWNSIVFQNDSAAILTEATPQQRVLSWGNSLDAAQRRQLEARGVPVWRVEDAFIRSVGLGKYYVPPLSLVIDKSGIYYDPNTPSDLETLLNRAEFSTEEIDRSRRLIDCLVTQKVTKYNLADTELPPLGNERDQPVILVPGQVESDASIAAGCVDIRTDQQLLREVRAARPDAFILYKPHPDVVSGNEAGDFQRNAELADFTVTEAGIDNCFAVADEVHTLTSLAGFEALLRGKQVVVYGLPFYAGWGLTRDRHVLERRQRRLTLEELVAGVLIRYPRYLNLEKRHFTTPEYAIETLARQRLQQQGQKIYAGFWTRLARKTFNLGRSLYYGVRN